MRLWNLLKDCTLISKYFPIICFQIEQGDCPQGFFRFLIEFRDLGMCAISPWESTIEITERGIKSDYKSNLEKFNTNTLVAVQRATDRAFCMRSKIQRNVEDNFFNQLFDGRWFESRDFAMVSPFEYYASSGGSYIVNTDAWKVKGDNATYTGLLCFESYQSEIVPYAIENATRELFPNARISRYKDGCYISIPLK